MYQELEHCNYKRVYISHGDRVRVRVRVRVKVRIRVRVRVRG
jgi:hypothetical protein